MASAKYKEIRKGHERVGEMLASGSNCGNHDVLDMWQGSNNAGLIWSKSKVPTGWEVPGSSGKGLAKAKGSEGSLGRMISMRK